MDQIPLVHSFFPLSSNKGIPLTWKKLSSTCAEHKAEDLRGTKSFLFLLCHSCVTRSIWLSARWGRFGAANSSFSCQKKIRSKTFKGLKLAISDFFIAPLFDESKKNYFIYTLRYTSAENLMLGIIAVCLHWATAQTRMSGKNANMNMIKSCTQYEALANIERCRDVRKFCT